MSLADVRKKTAELLAEGPPRFHCSCGTEVKGMVFADLGRRCLRCFESYCRSAPVAQKEIISVAENHPHAWAHRLRAKKSRGVVLTQAQNQCLAAFEAKHP